MYHMFTLAEYIRRRNPNRPGTSLPDFCISVREKLSDMQEATNQLEAATPAERECKEVYKVRKDKCNETLIQYLLIFNKHKPNSCM